MFQYNLSIYSSLYRLATHDLVVTLVWVALPFIFTLPIFLLGRIVFRDKSGNVRIWLAIMAVAFGCFHYLYQGKGWHYQIIPFYMFCSLLESVVFGKLIQGKLISQAFALILILPTIILQASFMLNTHYSEIPVQELKPAVPLLVSDLKMLNLTQQDGVQVMDAVEGGIHALYLLDHPQSTRYIYDSLFIRNTEKPIVKQLQESFITDLQNNPPRYIVVFIKGPFPEENGMERFSSFPRFLDFINTYYSITLEREYYFIFESKMTSPTGMKQ